MNIITLRQAWAAARGGTGGVVHLTGSVGCGLSTLLGRLLDGVGGPSAGNAAVLVARCLDESAVQSSVRGILEDRVVRVAEGVRAIEAARREGDDAPTEEVPWLLPGADFLHAATDLTSMPGADEAPDRAKIHADLLLDITRDHAVLLLVDDAHRADEASKRLVEAVCARLAVANDHRLLLVLASADPLDGAAPWRPAPDAVVRVEPLEREVVEERVRGRVSRYGKPTAGWLEAVLDAAEGNPMVADALVDLSTAARAFDACDPEALDDPGLTTRPAYAGLTALAKGRAVAMPANVRADLAAAAVLGVRLDVPLLARLWQVPEEAARERVAALCDTGWVGARGDRYRFLSAELAATAAQNLDPEARASVSVRAATLLRASGRGAEQRQERRPPLDVTETWSESRRREGRLRDTLAQLWSAARHFAVAERHAAAAEAAVTFAERLFSSSGSHLYLVGRFGRREDRQRRYRLYEALNEAGERLRLAKAARRGDGRDDELLSVEARLLTMRARLKQVMGDFTAARRAADEAVAMAGHLAEPKLRLDAVCTHLEVNYSAGDHNAGRRALMTLLGELEHAPRDEAVRRYDWLAEALARWEWPGLHQRFIPYVVEQLEALDARPEAVRARVERFTSAMESGAGGESAAMLDAIVEQARTGEQLPYLAELLALYAADLTQGVVDTYFHSLSGEFYPPDLLDEGFGPRLPPLRERLEPLCILFGRADAIAAESGHRVAQLRVLTTSLGVIYETRERLGRLLDRWLEAFDEATLPVKLEELVDVLERGFFDLENIEDLTNQTILIARKLDLDQVLADTVFEALDRDLPTAARRAGTLFELASEAYGRVGDAYGAVTLMLVEIRYLERSGADHEPTLNACAAALERDAEQLSPEQRAFVHQRLGELLLRTGKRDEATQHLEAALRLNDSVGDVEQLLVVGEQLREIYREQGDLARYRALRERFRVLEQRTPGFDPLGLEMRIEHLLTLARQEPDDEQAIGMVERCVQLFAHMPDGTTRIDECFVEISKICRRRADDAATHESFLDWRQRSLEAVRTATRINRDLGNYHRVFEELHELFDDLLALGAVEEYLQVRAECRAVAFSVGNVTELMGLFEEHLQFDPEAGFDPRQLLEVRGFYEALTRFLLGVGARAQARATREVFTGFLLAIGAQELAAEYQARTV